MHKYATPLLYELPSSLTQKDFFMHFFMQQLLGQVSLVSPISTPPPPFTPQIQRVFVDTVRHTNVLTYVKVKVKI